MKTIYSIVLLLLTTITTIHAQEPTRWLPERNPFATRNDSPVLKRDIAYNVSTTKISLELVMNARFLYQTEMFPDFTLSSGDFLSMNDLGLSRDSDPTGNYDGTAYGDVENALKIPVGNGIEIIILLLMGYVIARAKPAIMLIRFVFNYQFLTSVPQRSFLRRVS